MASFFKSIGQAIRFSQLDKSERRVTFYSEGKNYWPYLKDFLEYCLQNLEHPICFITSDPEDPALAVKNAKLKTFQTDEGFARNWLFENIDTDVMVMTMPDLHQYQVKRSKHPVHYLYIQHSLVSLHMVYRPGAFDHFDTIFCAGPHHVEEIREIEKVYDLPPKRLVEYGYPKLDSIREQRTYLSQDSSSTDLKNSHALIAPSWGPDGTIESGKAISIINDLINSGIKVTLRPHPQTIKLAAPRIEEILNLYQANPLFNYESNITGQESLHQSDFMISDWSGAALDYALGLEKPVLFVDVPRKVNNPNYGEISLEPIEVSIRNLIGKILKENEMPDIDIGEKDFDEIRSKYCYPTSHQKGLAEIKRILEQ